MVCLDDALSYLSQGNACPLCVVALDAESGIAIKSNSAFVTHFGPLHRYASNEFARLATDDGGPDKGEGRDGTNNNRARFRSAIDDVRLGARPTSRVRNVEMLTLAGESGRPVRRRFDWNVGFGSAAHGGAGVVLLYGDPLPAEEEEEGQRAPRIRESRSSLLLQEELERSLRMLDNFTSRTLHHVMGPLHTLQLTCDVVSDRIRHRLPTSSAPDDDEENLRLLEMAGVEIASAARTVRDSSDLARLDQGATLGTRPGSVALGDVGADALATAAASNPSSDGVTMRLDMECNGGGPEFITTDRAILTRVLGHLLDNAVRETEEGCVTLRIGHRCASDDPDRGEVTFEVEDTGPGLPISSDGAERAALPIFQRYHNEVLPKETKTGGSCGMSYDDLNAIRSRIEDEIMCRKRNGMGIGLPLTYHLVSILGGDLRWESTKGRGAKFWFALPLNADYDSMRNCRKRPRQDARQDGQASHSVEARQTSGKLTQALGMGDSGVKAMVPPSVLVVEDSDVCARVLCMQLRKFNISTRRAENGQAALDILRQADPCMFDLVLMDLRMPIMDGLEATLKIKDDPQLKGLPVVALTGELGHETKMECERIGFDEFCSKPLKRVALVDILRNHCGYSVPQMAVKTAMSS